MGFEIAPIQTKPLLTSVIRSNTCHDLVASTSPQKYTRTMLNAWKTASRDTRVVAPHAEASKASKTQRRRAQRAGRLAEKAWEEAYAEKAERERTWREVWDEAHKEKSLRELTILGPYLARYVAAHTAKAFWELHKQNESYSSHVVASEQGSPPAAAAA